MKLNLDAMKKDIQECLEQRGMVVFHGHARYVDSTPLVSWDAEHYPDFRLFLRAAEAAGVRLVSVHARQFDEGVVDLELDRLPDSEMSQEDRRTTESRLRELRKYAGFTCAIELSFDLEARVYVFDARTDWYEEFCDLVDDIDSSCPEEDEDEGPMSSGYFSRN